MAEVSASELQTLLATLNGISQQLGNIAKAITTGSVTRAGTVQSGILDVTPPTNAMVSYLSVKVNGQTIKLPYYTS
jgi:hypothetical protein